MEIHTCANCGSVYEVRHQSVPYHDKDTEECEVCKETILSWDGGVTYSTKLIEKKENHLT